MALAWYISLGGDPKSMTIYYCPSCLDMWTCGGHCWCEMRADVQPDASSWDRKNYPVLRLMPDQAAALAAYLVGGQDAVTALLRAQVSLHAGAKDRVP